MFIDIQSEQTILEIREKNRVSAKEYSDSVRLALNDPSFFSELRESASLVGQYINKLVLENPDKEIQILIGGKSRTLTESLFVGSLKELSHGALEKWKSRIRLSDSENTEIYTPGSNLIGPIRDKFPNADIIVYIDDCVNTGFKAEWMFSNFSRLHYVTFAAGLLDQGTLNSFDYRNKFFSGTMSTRVTKSLVALSRLLSLHAMTRLNTRLPEHLSGKVDSFFDFVSPNHKRNLRVTNDAITKIKSELA